MPDKELVKQLRDGDEAAFRHLVEQYRQKVFNTALSFLQDHHYAEDIAQDVFIQIYHSISSFKENAKLSTWIYRITISKCLDTIRNRKRKKRFAVIKSIFSVKNDLIHDPPEFNHPGVQLDRKEEAALLFKLIDNLPANQKTAFLLNKAENFSYAEIAETMNLSEAAVDALLQRAKQNLRKKIKKE